MSYASFFIQLSTLGGFRDDPETCVRTRRAERVLRLPRGLRPISYGPRSKMTLRLLAGIEYGLCQGKSVTLRQLGDLRDVPYTPLSVLRSQPSVELLIALSVVTAIDLVRAIEIENATRPERALCASH